MKKHVLLIVLLMSLMFADTVFSKDEPFMFIENKGQLKDTDGKQRPDILFIGEMNGMRAYFTKNSISYVLYQDEGDSSNYRSYRFDVEFENANRDVKLIPNDIKKTKYNYFNTGDSPGITGVESFSKLTYKNIYPNIDIEFNSTKKAIKYNIIVNPGGDHKNVRIKYKGIDGLSINRDGNLVIKTPLGTLEESIPETYQHVDIRRTRENRKRLEATKRNIQCSFNIEDYTVSFNVGTYRDDHPLIIDPVLKWGTYLGGFENERVGYRGLAFQVNPMNVDYAHGCIASDAEGNTLVTGSTRSWDFPADLVYHSGSYDVFVFKIDPTGTTRIWGTFLGGYGDELGTDIAVQSNGDVIAVGVAGTSGNYFLPVNPLKNFMSGLDGFITRLDGTTGFRLNWTYYGDDGDDVITGVTVDNSDNIYVVGITNSLDFSPVTQMNVNTCTNCPAYPQAFVAKFDQNLIMNPWTFFYGGSAIEYGLDIDAIDDTHIAFTGITYSSPAWGFPLVNAVFNQINNGIGGGSDGFVAVIEEQYGIPSLIFSTYYGGEDGDFCSAIAAPNLNTITVTGYTRSPNLPITLPPFGQNSIGDVAGGDAFVAQFDYNSGNATLAWSTFLGGSALDRGNDIIYNDDDGDFYVTGFTRSENFPLMDCYQSNLNNTPSIDPYDDAFFARFWVNGQRILSTYYGGDYNDYGVGIAAYGEDQIAIIGETSGQPGFYPDLIGYLPLGQHSLIDPDPDMGAYKGNGDAFIACFDPNRVSKLPTYFGGTGLDRIFAMDLDINENIYFTGYTRSSSFSAIIGQVNGTLTGNSDIFVGKYNSGGSAEWLTYIGGIGEESGDDIAVADNGNIYICGWTTSLGLATPGVPLLNKGVSQDGFLMRLAPDGYTVDWFTYFGDRGLDEDNIRGFDAGDEYCFGVAVDNLGHVAITGTAAPDIHMISAYQDDIYPSTSPPGSPRRDCFIAYYDDNGSIPILSWSTYLGGERGGNTPEAEFNDERASDIVFGQNGEVIICGTTASWFFPTFGTPISYRKFGLRDAFLSSFSSSGAPLYSTYFGARDDDGAIALTLDNGGGYAILAGYTESDANFASVGTAQTVFGGKESYKADDSYIGDAFLAKLDFTGGVVWSTYIGGDKDECFNSVCRAYDGIYAVGVTNSPNGISVPGVFQENLGYVSSPGDHSDAFIVKVSDDGLLKSWGTYFGGDNGDEYGRSVRYCGTSNSILISGQVAYDTYNDMPHSSQAVQPYFAGMEDGFIARLSTSGSELRKPAFEVEENQSNIYSLPIKVYPIPCDNILNIEMDLKEASMVDITVSNLLGQNLIESRDFIPGGGNTKLISVNLLPVGVYFLKIRIGDDCRSTLIMKGD